MHTSHSFKIAPPFFKSWLRACQYGRATAPKQARSQKFAMGGGCLMGLGAKPPAAGGWRSGDVAPSRLRHGGRRSREA